jgi:hypothetical protein
MKGIGRSGKEPETRRLLEFEGRGKDGEECPGRAGARAVCWSPYSEIALLDLPRKAITRGNFCPWLTGSLYRKNLIPQYTADREFMQKELNSSAYL